MTNIIESLVGDLNEKKLYRETEKRAKALPAAHEAAYKEMKKYIWSTSGIIHIDPLVSLVDILEEAAALNKSVVEVTGPDVAAFADELVKGEASYKETLAKKLNTALNK